MHWQKKRRQRFKIIERAHFISDIVKEVDRTNFQRNQILFERKKGKMKKKKKHVVRMIEKVEGGEWMAGGGAVNEVSTNET